jgi:type VI secretion system protein ImpA
LNGTLEPEPGRERPTEALVRGAFQRTDREQLDELRLGVDGALSEIDAITSIFERHAGVGNGPNFSNLERVLADIQKELLRFAIFSDVPDDETSEPEQVTGDDEVLPQPRRVSASGGSFSIRNLTSVETREDALYLLGIASAYFRAQEPSSPLPMLIDRACRLASMDFLDILRDLAPDGLGQAQLVAGLLSDTDEGHS